MIEKYKDCENYYEDECIFIPSCGNNPTGGGYGEFCNHPNRKCPMCISMDLYCDGEEKCPRGYELVKIEE